MKKILLLIALLPAASWCNQRAQGFCQQGGQVVVTSGLNSITKVQASYPQCTVTVYLTGTLTIATIYSDNSNTPLANPFTANSSGLWFFYAANGRYDVALSGAGIPSWTVGDILLADPAGGGTTVTSIAAGKGISVNQPTGAVTVTNTWGTPAFVNAIDYNFPAQTCSIGCTLSAGSNAITMAPGPLGVSGSASGYSVYLSGGTGSAEYVLVAGGTCDGTGTQSSCTLIATTGSHSGAWTVQSVMGGIPEAAVANPNSTIWASGSSIAANGPFVVSSGHITIIGNGTNTQGIFRTSGFTGAHILRATGTGILEVRNIGISGNAVAAPYAAIACSNGGALVVDHVNTADSYQGILSDSCGSTWITAATHNNGQSTLNKAYSFITIDCNFPLVAGENNVNISDSQGGESLTPSGSKGLELLCGDGISISNSGFGGATDVLIAPGGSKYVFNTTMTNLSLDFTTGTGEGISIFNASAPSTQLNNLNISGGWVNCEGLSSSIGIDVGFNSAALVGSGISFSGIDVEGCTDGYALGTITGSTTTGAVTITGGHIRGPGTGGSAAGILVDANRGAASFILNVSGTAVEDNFNGLQLSTAANGSIVGNSFCGNAAAVAIGAGMTGVLRNNACVDNVAGTVSDAATLALPIGPYFTLTGTGTTVTAFSGVMPAGYVWTMVPTNASPPAFTAGATIGNSCAVPVQNKPYALTSDGTKVWISGPGC